MAAQVRDRAQRTPDQVAVRRKHRGVWQEVTWARYWRDVEAGARMLLTLGIAQGDRVVILSENRYEWLLADTATVAAGGVTVGIDPTAASAAVADVLTRGATVVVAEDQEQVDKVLEAGGPSTPAHIVYLDGRGLASYDDPRLRWWEDAATEDAAHLDTPADDVAQRMATGGETSTVTVVAAAGGPVELSAADVAAMVERTCDGRITPSPSGRDMVLPFTSLADRDERLFTSWLNAAAGVQVHFAESLSTIRQDMRDVQPTIVFAPAHVWERLVADVERRLAGASRLKRWMWSVYRPVALRVGAANSAGDLRPAVRGRAAVGDLMVFRALRTRIGMRSVRHAAYTGSMPAETQHLLRGIGVPLSQVTDDRSQVGSP
jgi:long-chain acyl-CoA synthetase